MRLIPIFIIIANLLFSPLVAVEKLIDPVKWSPYQGKKTFQEAKEHCQRLNMRLPTIEELKLAEKAETTKGWKKSGKRYWAVNKNVKINNSTFMALASGFNENIETHKIDSQLGVFCANITDDSILLDKIIELEENNGSVEEIKRLSFQFYSAKFSDYQGRMTWDDANKKCKSIKMRLPTIDELKEAYTLKITNSWLEYNSVDYWSSTPSAESYYLLYRGDGRTLNYNRDDPNSVRCRR